MILEIYILSHILIQIFGQVNTILPAENETKTEIPNMQDNNLLSIKY